jgi:hypothetical protein
VRLPICTPRKEEKVPKTNGELPNWGARIDIDQLHDLYAPRKVERFAVPEPGIDNLRLSSVDTFLIPGEAEFTVEFEGYFRVARARATTDDWHTASIPVNLVDIRLRGRSDRLGEIIVRPNPRIVGAGQTFGPALAGAGGPPAKCRIAAGVTFEAPETGVTLYNAEPILLMNDAIESIPPVEDPNGAAHIYMLPLLAQANGKPQDGVGADAPVAYLTSLRYTVGDYITEHEAAALRKL